MIFPFFAFFGSMALLVPALASATEFDLGDFPFEFTEATDLDATLETSTLVKGNPSLDNFIASGGSPKNSAVWEQCQRGNGHLYEVVLVGSPLSWDDARIAAQALGPTWDLVTITSATENNFVEALFSSDPSFFNTVPSGSNRSGPWIGAFDVFGTTNFQWVTGEPVTFTDWGPSEPFGNGQTVSYTDFTSPFGDGSGVAWNDIGPASRTDGPIAYIAESSLIFCDGFE